ncbi:MAG: sporulation protein YunB [Clostridia bacterium]|nr:sporulation protein YunB [Clostridia bacterium]
MSKRVKLWWFFSVFFLLFVGVLLFFNYYVNPIIIEVSEATIKSLTSKSVNSAVQTVLNNTNVYDELIQINTDNDGNISNFSVKSILINKLGKEIGKTAQQNLEAVGSSGIEIPLGTLTGVPLLVGVGPALNFKVQPIGSFSSTFSSEFISAGINQTNHRIYLNIKALVSLVMPTASRSISTNAQILLCESIIVGKVPDTYLNSSSLDEMMNLIPN